MTESDIEDALARNRERLDELQLPDKDELQEEADACRQEAFSLQREADRLFAKAKDLKEQLEAGDYGNTQDEKKEIRALKEERKRLSRALTRARKSGKVAA